MRHRLPFAYPPSARQRRGGSAPSARCGCAARHHSRPRRASADGRRRGWRCWPWHGRRTRLAPGLDCVGRALQPSRQAARGPGGACVPRCGCTLALTVVCAGRGAARRACRRRPARERGCCRWWSPVDRPQVAPGRRRRRAGRSGCSRRGAWRSRAVAAAETAVRAKGACGAPPGSCCSRRWRPAGQRSRRAGCKPCSRPPVSGADPANGGGRCTPRRARARWPWARTRRCRLRWPPDGFARAACDAGRHRCSRTPCRERSDGRRES